MAKITRTTLKNFINKHRANLYVKEEGRFNGMSDMVEYTNDPKWLKAEPQQGFLENSYGVRGVYVVKSARNSIHPIDCNGYVGYSVSNCVGSFCVAIKK